MAPRITLRPDADSHLLRSQPQCRSLYSLRKCRRMAGRGPSLGCRLSVIADGRRSTAACIVESAAQAVSGVQTLTSGRLCRLAAEHAKGAGLSLAACWCAQGPGTSLLAPSPAARCAAICIRMLQVLLRLTCRLRSRTVPRSCSTSIKAQGPTLNAHGSA